MLRNVTEGVPAWKKNLPSVLPEPARSSARMIGTFRNLSWGGQAVCGR